MMTSCKTSKKTVEIIEDTTIHNVLSAQEIDEGWELLFDGEKYDNLRGFKRDDVPEAWSAVDGTLSFSKIEGDNSKNGDIVSKERYRNFDFKVDWKISEGGNSGIFLYIMETPTSERTYHTGLEFQVLDNDGHKDGKIISHRAGDLYDLVVSSSEPVKPVGQWNSIRIQVKDDMLTEWMNDVKIVETKLWDNKWRTMVAESKFAKWADFGTFREGHIGLQDHGNDVWYRNIKIKRLD